MSPRRPPSRISRGGGRPDRERVALGAHGKEPVQPGRAGLAREHEHAARRQLRARSRLDHSASKAFQDGAWPDKVHRSSPPDSGRRGGRAPPDAQTVLVMRTTKQLQRAEWKDYFDRFTRERLRDDAPGAVTVEVISPTLGDQFEVSAVRLLGLAYDPKSRMFEVLMEDVDHLTFEPSDIWVLEGEPGFISTVELVKAEGGKEIIYVRRSGPLALRDEFALPANEVGDGSAPGDTAR